MYKLIITTGTLLVTLAGLPQETLAQTLSPFSAFQGLTTAQLNTLQGKFTDVGDHERTMYTLAFAANGHTPNLVVFRPFYRTEFQGHYGGDYASPQTFTASTQELAAILNGIATLPEVTDGGVDGYLSFALSVVVNDTTKVFESVIDTTSSPLVFEKFLSALSPNPSGLAKVTSFACALGLLPGPSATDVSAQVAIRLRGFRRDRISGQYVGTVRVTNTGGQAIQAPLFFAFRPSENVSLISPDGLTCAVFPQGAPYRLLSVGSAFQPSQHVDVVLRFLNPDDSPIELVGQRVYSGSGFR